jgi:hypothetical protein
VKQQDIKKDDDKFKELVKRMKKFNELLGDYLDAIDMEEGDTEGDTEGNTEGNTEKEDE